MRHKEPKTVSVPGPAGRLMATVEGDGGLPILFVHEIAGDRTHWAETQHGLATRSVAFDLRGLGESGGAHGPFGVESAVEDVAAVADALLPEKFVLAGHGFGAAVAGAFASYFPERLAGLLYVEPVGDLRRQKKEDAEAWLANFSETKYGGFHEHWLSPLLLKAKEQTRTLVMKTLRTSRREAIAANMESLFGYNPDESFERFTGPTHALVTATGPETLVGQRPSLSHSVLQTASHWPMLDSPTWFHSELVRFLGHCKHMH
ncbi:alpha/beta fold hydrolase [Cystobacter fuscus]|uniref:alpha/beta fold hydrolase n=1 Tax=Cystobacter fuscus TaxID=43 RepID=UPI002B284671|nr:alpha/beta hydrolase [Cystobacter fuscus]